MCWIAFVKKESMLTTLWNQQDRWLDSFWIVTEWGQWYKLIRPDFKSYRKWIKKWLKPKLQNNSFVMLHHRKATIGEVKIENAHPFVWRKFTLMQNWSARNFHKIYEKNVWETDTEKLLNYIETRADSLEEIPEVMRKLKEYTKDTFGNLLIRDRNKRVMLHCDGDREIHIQYTDETETQIEYLSSYEAWKKAWKFIIGYLLFNFKWEVIEKNYEDKPKTTYTYNRYDCGYDYLSDYSWYLEWRQKSLLAQQIKEEQEQEAIEYDLVSDYINKNMVYVFMNSENNILENYLEYTYWVRTMQEFKQAFGYSYPFDGFRDALSDFFKN